MSLTPWAVLLGEFESKRPMLCGYLSLCSQRVRPAVDPEMRDVMCASE